MLRYKVLLASMAGIGLLAVPGVATAESKPSDPTSVIAAPDSDGANLRSCPSLPNFGVTTGECGAFDRLPNGTRVQMLCWTDGNPPEEGASPRWFWVKEVDGPNPDWKGFVWAPLVDEQIKTPSCDDFDDYTPAGPEILLEPGPAAPAGFRYAITLSGFTSGSRVTVTCHDSVSPEGFFTFGMTTDEAGSAFTQTQCFSGDGPDHWVTAEGVESSPITW